MGVPVVRPSNTPDRMRTSSASLRWVVNFDVPGLRLSSQGCKSASVSAMPEGQPSTVAPIAGPWLSPHVVKRNICPKVFRLMVVSGLLASLRQSWRQQQIFRRKIVALIGRHRQNG